MKNSINRVFRTTASVIVLTALTALTGIAGTASAQDAPSDEIIVTGIRQALETAIAEKRASNNLQEIIQAEDIGKLPKLCLRPVQCICW